MSYLTTYKLSDLYEISSGISTKPSQAGYGFPFCSFSTIFNNPILPDTLPDLMDTSKSERITYSIISGDVLLTRTSETVDELAMTSVALKDYPDATFSGFAKRLRPISDKTYPQFMAFFFRSSYFRKIMTNKAVMTLRASFNENIFNDIEIDLPPLSEQIKIGNLFYDIELKIRNNNSIYSNLEELSKLLYDIWFVKFDFPVKSGVTYKSAGGEMVEVDGQMVPKTWGVGYLGSNKNFELIKNGISKFDGVKKYITTSDVKGHSISRNLKLIDYQNRTSRANMQPVDLSLWFAKMQNSIKRIDVIYEQDYKDYILSTGFAGIKCNELFYPYVSLFINSESFEKIKDRFSNGSTQKAINDENIKRIKVMIPERKVLEDFNKVVFPMLNKQQLLIKENQILEDLRDLLIKILIK